MRYECPFCGAIYDPPKKTISICLNPGCQLIIHQKLPSGELAKMRAWQKSASFNEDFNSNTLKGKLLGSYLGGDLPMRIYPDREPTFLNKNDKAQIHISDDGYLLIRITSPAPSVIFVAHLSEASVSIESTVELEKKLRGGKLAAMYATAWFIPEAALLGFIGGVRKQVNKETYILQVGTRNSGGAFFIQDERAGRALARIKEQASTKTTGPSSGPSTKERLNSLQALLDDGLITNVEFDVKRTEIIGEI